VRASPYTVHPRRSPRHHDDGHPHFWPISDVSYASPVSHRDPAHLGRLWSRIEIAIGMALLLLLWRRYRHVGARVPLVLAALCYVAVGTYWSGVFGG